MAADASRLARIFIWREGNAPDLEYARQVMSAANPAVSEALAGDNPPIELLAIPGPWPAEPWAHAIVDLRSIPAPEGTRWDDTIHYDLAGWEGTDLRTGARLFAVTAYRRVSEPGMFKGRSVSAPRAPVTPVPQVPYYPQQPTGPVDWPPHAAQPARTEGQGATYPPSAVASIPGVAPQVFTGPLGVDIQSALFQSYAPFYANFGRRLTAGVLDLVFVLLLQGAALVGILWKGPTTDVPYLADQLGMYAVSLCVSLATFAIYHVVQWSVWGQTLGKRLVGIRVVRADGSRPSVGTALLRMVGYIFSMSLVGVGFLLIALDPRRQGLHDKLAETYVVPEEPGSPVPAGLPGYGSVAATPPPTPYVEDFTGELSLGMAAVAGEAAPSLVKMAPTAPGQDTPTTMLELPSLDTNWLEGSLGNTLPGLTTGHDTNGEGNSTARPGAALATLESERAGMNTPNWGFGLQGPVTEMNLERSREHPQHRQQTEQARTLFRDGLSVLDKGAEPGPRGYKVGVRAAREAVAAFRQALELVPNSVVYRYFYGVALRYAEGYEIASREFRQVLELDPSHYEARQQVAYGARWHDAFTYPSWVSPAPVGIGMPMPHSIISLLPPGNQAATRLALLREGGNKVAAFLSRTPLADWTARPTADMPARLQLRLTRTPPGPILALYVIVEDNPQNPFIGETFLNPHDPPDLSDDACLMGQHMLEQLARQDRTYLIFVDEHDRLLLSRKLTFDAATQVSLARTLYEVQMLPPQEMTPERFSQAAQWHMQNVPLDEVRFLSSPRDDLR